MSRYIDADEVLKHKTDHEMISTHLIYNAPTADVMPVVKAKNISKSGFLCSSCSFGDFGGFYLRRHDTHVLDGYEPEYCPNCGAKIEHRRMTVGEIKEKMCDNYCKHFDRIRATFKDIDEGQEELDRICERCPLNELEEVSDDN